MKKILFFLCFVFPSFSCSSIEDFINIQNSKNAGETAVCAVENSTELLLNITDIAINLNKYILDPTESNKSAYFPNYSLTETTDGVWNVSNGINDFVINTFNQDLNDNDSQWNITNKHNETLKLKHEANDSFRLESASFNLGNEWTCLAFNIVILEIEFVQDVISSAQMSGNGTFENDRDATRFAFNTASAITISAFRFIGGVLDLVFNSSNLDDVEKNQTTIFNEDHSFEITIGGKKYTIDF